jgi:hypothetical protein
MTASELLRDFIAPLAPGWAVQCGKWRDSGPVSRAIVIKPMGGVSASLIREPQLSLMVVGGSRDAPSVCEAMCETIGAAIRASCPAGFAGCSIGEPSYSSTAEDRPVFEVAVSVIMSY